ncbi:MAG: hypothetical protein ACLFVJ_18305 [Persicimonas sp.]
MRLTPVFGLIAALAIAGCAADDDSDSSTTANTQALETAPDDPAPDLEPDFDPQRERAVKKAWQERTPTPKVSEIDWKEAAAQPHLPAGLLDAQDEERLSRSPVPALVPERADLLDGATVTTGPHWYAVSLDGRAHDVYVSGTRMAFEVPSVKLPAERAEDFRITRNELIASLAFNAYGAAYVIEVECARPSEDARCTEDDYIVGLANDLGLVDRGGQR